MIRDKIRPLALLGLLCAAQLALAVDETAQSRPSETAAPSSSATASTASPSSIPTDSVPVDDARMGMFVRCVVARPGETGWISLVEDGSDAAPDPSFAPSASASNAAIATAPTEASLSLVLDSTDSAGNGRHLPAVLDRFVAPPISRCDNFIVVVTGGGVGLPSRHHCFPNLLREKCCEHGDVIAEPSDEGHTEPSSPAAPERT